MRAACARWSLALIALGVSGCGNCRGRRPVVVADDARVEEKQHGPCPLSSIVEPSSGQCVAIESMPREDVEADVSCHVYDVDHDAHFVIVESPASPMDDPAIEKIVDEARGDVTRIHFCPKGQARVLVSMPVGRHWLMTQDDANDAVMQTQVIAMPGAPGKTMDYPARRGQYLEGGAVESAGQINFEKVDESVLEVRIIGFDERAWFVDRFAIEGNGETLEAEGTALEHADGMGAIIEPGKMLRLRFHAPSGWSLPPEGAMTVVTVGRSLDGGKHPIAPSTIASFAGDDCPAGSAREGAHDCVASEPVVDATTKPVPISIECHGSACGFLRWPDESVPYPKEVADWEAEAKVRAARGEPVYFSTTRTGTTFAAAPGRYVAVQRYEPYAPIAFVVWVEPRTPFSIVLPPPTGNTHCPRVAVLDPSSSSFHPAGELLTGFVGALAKKTMRLGIGGVSVKDGVVDLRVTEMEPETTYLDQLVAEIDGNELPPIDAGVLARPDGRFLRLDENRQIHVRFRAPPGATFLTLIANGYYVRHDGK